MNWQELQAAFQQPYAQSKWLDLLHTVLPGTEIFSAPQPVEIEHKVAKRVAQLGKVRLSGDHHLAVLEIEVGNRIDVVRNRVGLRNFVARFIDQERAHGVLAIFLSPERDYRFTFAAKESVFSDEGTLTKKETAPRRYTYVLGPNEPCRTPAERFAELSAKTDDASLSDVIAAFSVDKLNKEFFTQYKHHYQKFCAHLLDGDTPARVFGVRAKGLDEKARDHALKRVRDFVKKLLGRLVFLHFLQKKGWLGCPANAANWKFGDPYFLAKLFRECPAREQDRFHSRRLVPLFFETLNQHRKDDLFTVTGTRVPYLNGGLFERDFEGVEEIDFPGGLFKDLLEFFGQYNFTIDENDPDEHEIGIDPEMLGHIFENLLEDNKDKGAFYTPKAIVQYMCQQSLIYYLKSHLGERAEIESLVRRKDPGNPADMQNWIRQNAKQIEQLLDDVKICDPAIGSGAFPIGLLQEIYWIKLSLDWTLDRAEAKRRIIQHSIYGVDLDAGAVEIARLRFWLALIVEEDTPRPLPNLDYKIMQGDSLLESFEGIDLNNLTGRERHAIQLLGTEQTELGLKAVSTELTVEFAEGKQAEITSLISGYFDQTDLEQKQRLHRQIDKLVLGHIEFNLDLHEERLKATLDNARKELKRKQTAARGYRPTKKEAGCIDELEAQLAEVDRKRAALAELQDKPERPFFLWHLFFQDVFARGGFDIVIANPPYGADIDQRMVATLRASYTCLANSLDSFIMFMERATKLLGTKGCLAFIIPSGWVSTPSSGKLRLHYRDHYRPRVFVSLPYDVFGEAYVDTNILIGSRLADGQNWENQEDKKVDLVVFPIRYRIKDIDDFAAFQKEGDFGLWKNPLDDGFLVTASRAEAALVAKLRQQPRIFDDFVEVMRGIETFHPTANPRIPHKHLALTGDIYRYQLRVGPPGYIGYPPEIEEGKPWRFFSGPRLLLRQLLSRKLRLQATFVDSDFLTNQSVQSLVAREGHVHQLYPLLAILNSKLISWFFCQVNMVARRDDFPKTIIKVTRRLPLPDLLNPDSSDQLRSLTSLVGQMLKARSKDDEAATGDVEGRIDSLVYQLYRLTPQEVTLIENYAVPSILQANQNAKNILFYDVLPSLGQSKSYFSYRSVVDRVGELGLEISEGTLPVYLSEATASGLIHDAGRGWYSRLSEPVPLDPKPVAKLIRAVEKAFPLLEFTVWSTSQINPWMHHLLAQPVAFLHAPTDALESVGDTLRAQGWEVAVDPGKKEGPKAVRPGDKMVVLRPTHSKQPAPMGRQAKIEQILVDLQIEAGHLKLMDTSEAQGVIRAILNRHLVQVAELQMYADFRTVKLNKIEIIN